MTKKEMKLSSLFTQEEIDALKSLVQKSLEGAQTLNSMEYTKPTVTDLVDKKLNTPVAKPPVLPLDQQKAIIQYAPKDKLWDIIDLEDSWYEFLQRALPKQYLMNFIKRMEELAIKDPKIVAEMANMFVKNKVTLEDLQAGVSSFWAPDNLEESTEYLYTQGLVQNTRVPPNLKI
jgi:hypothetical protein